MIFHIHWALLFLMIGIGQTCKNLGQADFKEFSMFHNSSLKIFGKHIKKSTTIKWSTTTQNNITTQEDEKEGTENDCKCGLARRVKVNQMGGGRDYIVGGHESEKNEYPWQVFIKHPAFVSPCGCGGSIIGDRWILTAAHCLRWDSNPSNYKIVLGGHDITMQQTSLSVGVERIISHKDYNLTSKDYDFALIKLNQTIDFAKNPHMRPICLPKSDAGDFAGEKAIIIGWGFTQEDGNCSNVLKEAEVNVMSNKNCMELTDITERMICAGILEGGTDTCKGDSGGPLISSSGKDGITPGQNYELIGVTSFGPESCARPNLTGVYARVTEIIGWIDEIAGNLKTCPRM